MILIGYHGTNTEIEVFDLNHLGSGQGQSRFPGIYFSENFEAAKNYSNLAVDKNGGEPRVYVAECLLEKPLDVRKGTKLFNSFGEILNFIKEYFPKWFDENGNLLPYKEDYVTSKYETYDGQYNLIKYASEANDIPLIEVCLGLGFDSWVGDTEFVITSPQQILSFMEVDHQLSPDEINQERLPADESLYTPETASAFETTSNQYIQASKKGRPYKTKPGNRFLRRVYIKMNGGNNVWFDIDMNRLFRKGSFAVKIPVVGETKEYIDTISFEDWLPKLKEDIARTGFTQLTVKRSLMEMLRFHDLKVRCTCPDFCFTGETKISLLDGRELSISEIVEEFNNKKDLWVYSTNDSGDFRPGKITDAFKTGERKELIRITLDNGEVVECTPEHRFMLRDGSYLKASSLIEGQSLMPLYFGTNRKGYRTVKSNSEKTTKMYSVYKLVAKYTKSLDEFNEVRDRSRLIPENHYDVAIHHSNFNKNDNTPSNLLLMTPQEHWKLHSSIIKENGVLEKFLEGGRKYWETAEARSKQSLVAKRSLVVWNRGHKEELSNRTKRLWETQGDKLKKSLSAGARRRWDSLSEEEKAEYVSRSLNKPGAHSAETYKKRGKSIKAYMASLTPEERKKIYGRAGSLPKSEEHKKKISASHVGIRPTPETRAKLSEMAKRPESYKNIPLILAKLKELNLSPTEANFNKVRLEMDKPRDWKVRARWQRKFSSWEEVCSKFGLIDYNHSILKIERVLLETPVPVYDITVDIWNNFRLSAGIIVHNCYRFAYPLTLSGDIEGDPETRPANKTNPRNDLGKLCKHLNFCFIGDTKIRTLDGKTQTLIELKKRFDSGESLWAYSVDSKGDFVPGKITDVFETGEVTNLCKITLDNGKTITCTPDHLFMARSGEWVMAKDLSEGFSLMPLYFNKSKKGYELVKMNSTGKFSPTYFRVANNLYRDKIEKTKIDSVGENRPGVAIHHKDFHKENNSPENLEVMTICGHIRYHSENGSFIRLWKDPVFRKKYSKISSEFMSKLQANPTEALLESRRNPYWKGKSLPEEVRKKISQSNLGKKRSKETRERMSMSSMGRTHSEETRKKLSTLKSGVPWNERMRASCSTENHFIKKSQSQKRVWENYSEEKKRLLEEKRVKTRKLNRSLGLSKDISEISYSKDNSGFSNLTPEYQRKILRRIRKIILSVLNSGENLTPENYNKIRVTFPPGYRTRWQLAFKTLDEAVSFYQINHKVVKVEILEVPLTKVYDLTVENYHNFLVEDSVIVHNCLNNKVWGDKESRIIYNYMINLKRTQRRLFDKLIAPKLGLETQEEEEERLEAERLEREKPNQVNDQIEQELEDQVQGEQPIEQIGESGEGGENN